MNIRLAVKSIVKKIGVDLRAYHPSRSEAARLGRLLNHYGVDLVLDAGANSGQFAEYLRYVGYTGRIVCFEPLVEPYRQLRKLAARDQGITCAPPMALGEFDGEINIHVAANHESSSVLRLMELHAGTERQMRPVDCRTVPLHRLDSVAQEYLQGAIRPFLKIDVQGYEAKVLEGAAKLLPRLAGLQLELSLTTLYEGEKPYGEMLQMVEQAGFMLHDLNPCYSDPETGRTLQVDALFFRC